MSKLMAVPSSCAKAVDDILTGLDSGARWLRNEIGLFGLLCALVSLGMLAFFVKQAGG